MKIRKTYDFLNYLNESIKNVYISESSHIIETNRDIINDITDKIYDDFNKNKTPEKIYYSGWIYFPDNDKFEKCNISEIKKSGRCFPVYYKYEFRPYEHYYMAVEDRNENKNRIIISIEIYNINSVIFDKFSLKDFIHIKLSHEFTHIREFYGNFDKILSNSKKYNIECSGIFKYDFPEMKNYIENTISDWLYIFSATEEDSRINETCDALMKIDNNEIIEIMKSPISNEQKISKLIYKTDDYNFINRMKNIYEDIKNQLFSNKDYEIILISSFFFMKYNRFKPTNRIFITKKHIQDIINGNTELNKEDKKTAFEFLNFINKDILNYQKKLYDSIIYILDVKIENVI